MLQRVRLQWVLRSAWGVGGIVEAKATGRGGYLLALGLGERQLYELMGNRFDADALIALLAVSVRALGGQDGRPPL